MTEIINWLGTYEKWTNLSIFLTWCYMLFVGFSIGRTGRNNTK